MVTHKGIPTCRRRKGQRWFGPQITTGIVDRRCGTYIGPNTDGEKKSKAAVTKLLQSFQQGEGGVDKNPYLCAYVNRKYVCMYVLIRCMYVRLCSANCQLLLQATHPPTCPPGRRKRIQAELSMFGGVPIGDLFGGVPQGIWWLFPENTVTFHVCMYVWDT